MKGIALIGCGYWGKNLARVLHELDVLAVICDTDKAADDQAAAFQVPRVASVDRVLADDDVSAVVIATPAATHFAIVRAALEAGRDVFVEKPLALELSDAEQLKVLAEQSARILMVGHLLLYHPGFVRLKEIADQGVLGRLQYIYAHRLNLGKIRTEENILWSFAPHDISMILSLARAMPKEVRATGHCYLHGEIADITTTQLEFANGLRAHIFVSWLHPFKEQKLVVVGDEGMAVFDDTRPLKE